MQHGESQPRRRHRIAFVDEFGRFRRGHGSAHQEAGVFLRIGKHRRVLYMNHQFRFRGHQRPNRADMVKMPVREQNRGNRAPVRRFADALRLVAGVNHHAVSARIVPEDVAARSNRADGDFLHLQHGSILLRQNALVESIKIVTGPSLTSDTCISARKRPVST